MSWLRFATKGRWPRVSGLVLLAMAAAVTLSACAQTSRAIVDRRMANQILWPGDPELAVVEYLWSIHTVTGRPEAGSLVRILAGDAESPTTDPRDSRFLVRPYGVFVDQRERLYVTDIGAARVTVVDLPTGESFSFFSAGDRDIKAPLGIVATSDGRIYVADGGHGAVFIFGPEGGYLGTLETDFGRPVGLALDEARGRLYVSDTLAHVVYVFSTEVGGLIGTIGGRGTEAGKFNYPTHMCVDAEGTLYVSDALNFRIQLFDATGRFVDAFGELGDLLGNLEKPKGVAVDGQGHIYVVDAIQDTVKVFDREGRLLLFFGEKGNNLGQFWLPSGIFIDRNDRIYLADTYHGRVAAFRFMGRK